MNRKTRSTTTIAIASCVIALAAFFSPHQARAEFLGSLLEVQVSSGSDSGLWTLEIPASSNPFSWKIDGPVNVYGTENPQLLLATIDDLSLTLDGDPQVLVNFAVTAGGVNTAFSISSATVLFSPISNPDSFATAAVTVTDNNSNGATVTGSFAGTKAYEAVYNGGSVFADLVSPVVAPSDSSNIGSERNPVAGTIPIPGSVSSIAAGFSFVLTANDSASGTSRFSVVPEPSTVVLALIGGLSLALAIRRRKSK